MQVLTIDGKVQELEWGSFASFGDLLKSLKSQIHTPEKWVSEVKIDGVLVNESNLDNLAGLKLDQFKVVEILTSKPKEVFDQLLVSMKKFLVDCQTMSTALAGYKAGIEFEQNWIKLIDGLEIFMDSIRTLKIAKKVKITPALQVVEAEFESILQDLADAREQKHEVFFREILQNHLPKNLQDWVDLDL